MIIRNMFEDDINRKINGVIKVDQDAKEAIEQEVREYVITKELKKHFISFFDYYSDAIDNPTDDIGVWISGFFGSGKSHFLKMLSYILENKQVGEMSTVEMFRKKFEDDPATFMLIDKSTRCKTETILFNIDIEGFSKKDSTAVLKVFAKMFYKHLGFHVKEFNDFKVVMLEKYIEQLGKTEEFRRIFEEKKGKAWIDQRSVFGFNSKYIIPTLVEVLDISEEDAKNWFNDKTEVDFSIASLVEDIKEYVNKQPNDFRLLFMIDEVGQYVGTDTSMLLNLQSMIEKIGSECGGKVWVVCTGQEAIDEIIKVRADEFSRIQARFKTRLSLSSSSVDEVIQKRILKKNPQAEKELESVYEKNDSVLRNLFSFSNSIMDIKGFTGANEFAVNFPFVPYQFIIMQKVFAEIRKHGNSGKHLSGGERSMLSGFQEAAQKIQDKDEYALVPFFRFYDTVHSFLDSSIRRVIERCKNAADSGAGIEQIDVDVLKLLYLIRYVDDIPSNIDNIVILMADDIRTDKIVLREKVSDSLNRLMGQNYIGRSGDIYNFLTDEEQDIQKDIKNTVVDTYNIVERIAQIIYSDIYQAKKFRYGKYDFEFDKMVDGVTMGSATGGMKLRFLTVATDMQEKSKMRLITESKGQAIGVMSGSSYYEMLENSMKIRKYVKQRNIAQLPKSMQDIIRNQNDEAGRYEQSAEEEIKKAIINAEYYVDGEYIEIKSGDAKSHIEQALECLVGRVYSKLDLIKKHAETDADIIEILNDYREEYAQPNRDAAANVEEYLIIKDKQNLPTSMFDVQSRYQAIPYGWREIDIAAVVALLINQQKVTIKYGGATVQPNDPRLIDLLRKKSEIGKTTIAKRQIVTAVKMKNVKELLREYFDVMDVPDDEDGLVAFIIKKFEEQKAHYESLEKRYNQNRNYPDKNKVVNAAKLMNDILAKKNDNIALIDYVLKQEDNLFDNKEDLQDIESFFKTQVQIFDAASQMESDLRNEVNYIAQDNAAYEALNKIRLIVLVQERFDYKKIPELNSLMAIVREGYNRLLDAKRNEVNDIIVQCKVDIQQASNGDFKVKDIVDKADEYYKLQRQKINEYKTITLIESLTPAMIQYKHSTVERIESALQPPKEIQAKPSETTEKIQKKVIKPYNRAVVFPPKTLETAEDVDDYVEKIRSQLKQLLKNCDGIQLK